MLMVANITFNSVGPLIAGFILVVSGIIGIIVQKNKSK